MANENKKTIIFDLDGTLSDFEAIDHKIIDLIYGNFKFVMFLDKLLWSINRLDILKNNFFILKLRLIVYSILSKKRISEAMNYYRIEYFTRTYRDLKYNYENYLKTLKMKYKIVILSNNMYAKGLCYKGVKVVCNTSKLRYIMHLKKHHNIAFIIGNNMFDDIFSSNFVNIYSIYIGSNPVVKIFAKKNFREIDEMATYLIYKSD